MPPRAAGLAINLHASDDVALLAAISDDEFTRNRDIWALLFSRTEPSQAEQKRQAAAVVSGKLHILSLRAHRSIRKVPHTPRYCLTKVGRIAVTEVFKVANSELNGLPGRVTVIYTLGAGLLEKI